MGQAVEQVREAADDVTETVYDDGVAVELERCFRCRGRRARAPELPSCPAAERLRLILFTRRRRRRHARRPAPGPAGTPTTRARTTSTRRAMVQRAPSPGARGTSCSASGRRARIGFFGPPRDGRGRGRLRPGRRRARAGPGHRGAAGACSPRPTGWACGVRARVEPDNRASIRVLAKAGFTELRGSDEEGHLVMARPVLVRPITRGRPADADRHRPRRHPPAHRRHASPTPPGGCSPRSRTPGSPSSSSPGARCAGWTSSGRWSAPTGWRRQQRRDPLRRRRARRAATWWPARSRARSGAGRRGGRCRARRARSPIECLTASAASPTFVDPHRVPEGSPVGSARAICGTSRPSSCSCATRAWRPTELQADVVAAVGDLGAATWSMPGLVEISAPGVTKAAALARAVRRLGVDAADVVAFGDMPNDLPMLDLGRHVLRRGQRRPVACSRPPTTWHPPTTTTGWPRCWPDWSPSPPICCDGPCDPAPTTPRRALLARCSGAACPARPAPGVPRRAPVTPASARVGPATSSPALSTETACRAPPSARRGCPRLDVDRCFERRRLERHGSR